MNGLLLVAVTLYPFSTSLLSAYILTLESRFAILVYAATGIAMAICFNSLWRYASRNGRLLEADHDPKVAEGITKSYRFGPIMYLITFALGFARVAASVGLSQLMVLYFTIPPRKHTMSPKPEKVDSLE